MPDILTIFTPEQLFTLMKNKILADDVGFTDFNVGSSIRTLLEAIALIESTTGFDYLEGLRNSIPIALYDGLGFTKKSATRGTGFLRFFRIPEFYMEYTGVGTDCLLTISAIDLTTTCAGAGGDNLSLSFVTFPTVSQLVTAINGTANYNATLVGLGNSVPSSLFQWVAKDILGATNHLAGNGFDVMVGAAPLVTLIAGLQASIDQIFFRTTAAGSIPLGEATSAAIAAESINEGITGNILAQAINTLNGKGVLNTPVNGVEHVINDSAFSGGENEESDEDRARRFQVFVQGLSGSTVKGIESAVLNIAGIKSVTIRERFPQPGFITVIADDGTGNLSIAQIDLIRKTVEGDPNDFENFPGHRAAGILLNVDAPDVVAVNVTITIIKADQFPDEAEISIAVQSAIEN